MKTPRDHAQALLQKAANDAVYSGGVRSPAFEEIKSRTFVGRLGSVL